MTSLQISLLLYWLVRLACVFGVSSACYLLLWLGSQIWKKESVIMPQESETWNSSGNMTKRRVTDGIWPNLLRWTLQGSLGVAIFVIGYATRDLQSYRRTTDRSGDVVIRRDDASFRAISAVGKEFETDLCPGSIPNDFSVGHMIDWTYEQMPTCKRLVRYSVATDPTTGRRLIFEPILRKEVSANVQDVRR